MSTEQQILDTLSTIQSKLDTVLKSFRKEWFTLNEAAEYLRMKPRTLRDRVRDNKITYCNTGKAKMFHKKHLDAYLMNNEVLTDDLINNDYDKARV